MTETKRVSINASSVSRYNKCNGCFSLEQSLPKELRYNAFEDAAGLGRQIHSAGEESLKDVVKGGKVRTLLQLLKEQSTTKTSKDYDKAANAVKGYRKHFKKIYNQRKKEYKHVKVLLEEKYETVIEGIRCVFKADCIILSRNPNEPMHIDFMDLKTGNWDYVVSANAQMLYSLNIFLVCLNQNPDNTIRCTFNLHTVQPNYWDTTQSVNVTEKRNWSTDDAERELIFFVDALKSNNTDFNFGDHCSMCPAIVICPEKKYFMQLLQGYQNMFEGDIEEMTPSDLEMIWVHRKSFEAFLKAVDQRVGKLIESGTQFDTLYKKETYGKRYWTNTDETIKYLKNKKFKDEDIFEPRKLKSPAQIEKIVGKENIADLWDKQARFSVAERTKDELNIFKE